MFFFIIALFFVKIYNIKIQYLINKMRFFLIFLLLIHFFFVLLHLIMTN